MDRLSTARTIVAVPKWDMYSDDVNREANLTLRQVATCVFPNRPAYYLGTQEP